MSGGDFKPCRELDYLFNSIPGKVSRGTEGAVRQWRTFSADRSGAQKETSVLKNDKQSTA